MSSGSEDGEKTVGERRRHSVGLSVSDTAERIRRTSVGHAPEDVCHRKHSIGCERKVSIRRRKISSIAVGENPKPIPVIQWGQQDEEYELIVKRVMADPYVTESIEGLKERLRLLQLMHDDCEDMIAKRIEIEKRKKNRIEMKRTFVILTYVFVAISIFVISLKIVTILVI